MPAFCSAAVAGVPRAMMSVGLVFEHRLHGAAPRAVEFLDQFLGRGRAARDDVVERLEMTALVATADVDAPAAREALVRERQAVAREIAYDTAADRCLEAEPRHVVTQLLAF